MEGKCMLARIVRSCFHAQATAVDTHASTPAALLTSANIVAVPSTILQIAEPTKSAAGADESARGWVVWVCVGVCWCVRMGLFELVIERMSEFVSRVWL
eukprot:m.25873 g.25873  ORF g.25873 m.25873 type:complete len:99 (+) comp13650_c0_seq1:558-854(+)